MAFNKINTKKLPSFHGGWPFFFLLFLLIYCHSGLAMLPRMKVFLALVVHIISDVKVNKLSCKFCINLVFSVVFKKQVDHCDILQSESSTQVLVPQWPRERKRKPWRPEKAGEGERKIEGAMNSWLIMCFFFSSSLYLEDFLKKYIFYVLSKL